MKKRLIVIGIAVVFLIVWLLACLFMQSILIPISSTLLGLFLILGVLCVFKRAYNYHFSVQFVIIIGGTLILMIISWLRDSIFPNFDNLPIETSRLFLPLLVNGIVGIFAVFGIAFSILWGSMYLYYMGKGHGYELKKLKHQGFVLLAFLSYFVLVLFLLFIQPLYSQLNV